MAFMYSKEMLGELGSVLESIDEEAAAAFCAEIQKANAVFCDGLGRSGLCCKAFAMRLMQMGIHSFVVGEVVTTAICAGDLLVLCSGSGESATLISRAEKAKQQGARVALVTGKPHSTLGRLADTCLAINAPEKEEQSFKQSTVLPMASLFENGAALLFENIVMKLMEERKETSQTMMKRHANLE